MVVDILQNLNIYEAEGGLYNSEHHIIFFVFVFEEENDVDDVIQNIAHFLTIRGALE